jgi:hypothetical protein
MIRLEQTARLRGFDWEVQCARFDDLGALADHIAFNCRDAQNWTREPESAWIGATGAQTMTRARYGDAKRVALADDMLAKLENAVGFEARRWRAVDAVAGGVPNVPAYLSGAPLAMRRRARVMDAAAPLTIAIDLGVSQSVNDRTIARRGAAALALARIAAGSRPVALWVYFAAQSGGDGDAMLAVKLDTAPLDVARAAWLLCAPEALRRAGFSVLEKLGGWEQAGSVSWLDTYETHKRVAADLAAAVTGADDFLNVPGLLSNGDVDFGSDDAAAAWVRAQLEARGALERAA